MPEPMAPGAFTTLASGLPGCRISADGSRISTDGDDFDDAYSSVSQLYCASSLGQGDDSSSVGPDDSVSVSNFSVTEY